MNSTNGSADASLADRVTALAAKVAAEGYNLIALSQIGDEPLVARPDDSYALQAPYAPPQNWWQCTNWADLETIERAVANGLQSAAAFVAEVNAERQLLRRSKGQYELQL
jgi:hypothetical protein